jgi:hypothetical protein
MMHIVALRETKGAAPKTPPSPVASTPAPQVADKPRDDAERARERATERAWFGAPTSGQPNASVPRPQPVSVNGMTPVDSSSSTSAPVQQVAEKQPADAGVPRIPAADKAWFGGNHTR